MGTGGGGDGVWGQGEEEMGFGDKDSKVGEGCQRQISFWSGRRLSETDFLLKLGTVVRDRFPSVLGEGCQGQISF